MGLGAYTLPVPPPATGLTANQAGTNTINLAWVLGVVGTPVTGIHVYRSTDSGVTYSLLVSLGMVISYSDTSCAAGTRYDYKVRECNATGESADSNSAHDTTLASTLPDADTFEGYSTGAFPAPSGGPTWLQADSSVGGHNTGVVAVNPSPALDATGAQVLYQGLARTSVLWRANATFPLGVIYPGDAIVQVYTDAGGSSSLGTDGTGVIFRAFGMTAGGNLTTLNGYAALTTYHGGIALFKIVNGVLTLLGSAVTSPYIGGGVAHVPIGFAQSNVIKAGLYVPGTAQYLTTGGAWVTSSMPVYAISLTDNTYGAGGFAGVYSTASGQSYFDDWAIKSAVQDITPPVCTMTSPVSGNTYNGTVNLTATATDDDMASVGLFVNGVLAATIPAPGPYTFAYPTSSLNNGSNTAVAKAYDLSGNEGDSATITFNVTGSTRPTAPTWPTPNPSNNFEFAAYNGYPNGGPGGSLTDGSTMDAGSAAIVGAMSYCNCNTKILAALRAAVPTGLFTVYSNISQLYKSLKLDWLNYADKNSYSREDGFIHATVLTSFNEISTQDGIAPKTPWQLYSTADNVNQVLDNFADNAPTFPAVSGQSLYVGNSDPFRSQMFVTLFAAAGAIYVLEYCNAVDGSGNPTSWATTMILTDGTGGFSVNGTGTVDYDPPADWVACKGPSQPNGAVGQWDSNGLSGGFGDGSTLRYFYMRWRCTHSGTPPTASALRLADYTGSGSGYNGSPLGAVPAYDYVLDAKYNSPIKGYLTKSQYNDGTRAAGKDAWFAWQGRIPDGNYGFDRTPTNPTTTTFQAWCIDYHNRLFAAAGGGDYNGIDMDNCSCTIFYTPANTRENIQQAAYATGLGTCLKGIWLNAGTYRGTQRFVDANNGKNASNGSGSNNLGINLVKLSPSIATESLFQTFKMGWPEYNTACDGINAIATSVSPPPMIHLDADSAGYPTGLFASQEAAQADPQSAYNLLCCYYTVQQQNMFFPMYSGDGITDPFTYHYSGSIPANIGTPTDPVVLSTTTPWQTGTDPANSNYPFNAYARRFSGPGGGNLVAVLYRPCSAPNGTLVGAYATGGVSQSLSGLIPGVSVYYPLTPGSVHTGAAITSISLTNGQGVILFTSPV